MQRSDADNPRLRMPAGPALQARIPGSSQVTLLGLERASDRHLCEFAARQDFVICTTDDDFHRIVVVG